jgi:hypothetical protein
MAKLNPRAIVHGILTLLLLGACANGGEIYEEKTTVVDGVATECGEGPGLPQCRDAQGNTYEQDANPDAYFSTEGDEQLEKDGERMRNEDPEQFEQTTEELEQEQWQNE